MESRANSSSRKGEMVPVNVPASLRALAVFCFIAGTMGSVSFLSSSIRLSVYTPLPVKVALLVLGGVSSSFLIMAGMRYLEGDRRKGFRMGLIQAAVSFARGGLNAYAISVTKLLPIDLFDFILPCFLILTSYFTFKDEISLDANSKASLFYKPSTHSGMMFVRAIKEKYNGILGICQLAFIMILVLTVTQLASTSWEAAIKAGAKTLIDASSLMEPLLKALLSLFQPNALQEKLLVRFLLYERTAPLSIVFTIMYNFIPFIVVFGSASSISSEIANGRAKLNLIRMTRTSYYYGKFFSEVIVNSCIMAILSLLIILYVFTGFRYSLTPLILPSIIEGSTAMITYSLAWTGFVVMVSSLSDSSPRAYARILAAIALLLAFLWTKMPHSPLPDVSILGWFLPVLPGAYLFNAASPMRMAAGLGMVGYTFAYFKIGAFFFARRSV